MNFQIFEKLLICVLLSLKNVYKKLFFQLQAEDIQIILKSDEDLSNYQNIKVF